MNERTELVKLSLFKKQFRRLRQRSKIFNPDQNEMRYEKACFLHFLKVIESRPFLNLTEAYAAVLARYFQNILAGIFQSKTTRII